MTILGLPNKKANNFFHRSSSIRKFKYPKFQFPKTYKLAATLPREPRPEIRFHPIQKPPIYISTKPSRKHSKTDPRQEPPSRISLEEQD